MTAIHADPSLPVHVQATALPWDPSPAPGVERKRIERVGDERARVTSLVRYAPGTRFPEHTHGGGEEFLVLEGVFSDETGDYPAGSYVRNGVGSAHTPASKPGCTLFVKLWWMHPDETTSSRVRIHDEAIWTATDWGKTALLHNGPHDRVDLWRIADGATLTTALDVGCELFVLDGRATLNGEPLKPWSWVRCPDPQTLRLTATAPTTLYIKRGHLVNPPAPPVSL
ncbi:MAG: cupin domain-containing protein [Myxococcota bacterium]